MAKIVVGMSGGVDSSVVAHLLKEQGHEVIGLFMQNWDSAVNNDTTDPYLDEELCQASQDYNDAVSVGDKIGIRVDRVNFVQEYWDLVFEEFLEKYKKGLTPNPDILCNKYIKFNVFAKYAFENYDCDYIATGHYARVTHDGKARMFRGLDSNKDQTYFLEQLSYEQLDKVLFPLGDLNKSRVREIARDAGLIVSDKKDSTGICFIGNRKFNDFLRNYLKNSSGDFIDIDSKKFVAKHKGLMHYTIGQRKNMGIGGLKDFEPKPWYVVSKDVKKNIVYISQDSSNYYLLSNEVIITNVNIINEDVDIKSVQFRYRSSDVVVKDYEFIDDNTIKLIYEDSLAVTPGQAAAFYHDDECLGGGEISQVFYNGESRAYENWDNN